MADEILIVDNTVEEIEVEEFNGVPTGTIITTTHGYGKGEQHPIEDITGLKTKLDNIEKLKPVRSNLSGHGEYYLSGEEATEDNPLGPGYFVRLGEDGMIHKCANETIVLRPKDLPLDTNENGEVIIYALAGNITTADITKYYVVGTEAPYDIYAYDGIEYVQKSAYSYDGKQVIKTCHTTDMLGVTVSSAGFIGNDENATNTYTSAKATDINYALVATSGVVDVLCGLDVTVGDYVFPTVNGWAAKSTGSYGYLVTALVQNGVVVQQVNKEEMLYARIVLSQSMINAKKVADNVDYLLAETKRIDENITAFGNTAEVALKRAEELTEAAQQSANASSQNVQNATNAAVNAQNSAANAWDAAEQAAPIAQKAAEDARVAQEAASTLRNEAIAEANELATQIATDKSNETLNTVRALEYRLDEYTVGQYSQAYGLTYEQAKAILPIGTVFIPMDEDPTAINARQTYKEVYANEEADVEQIFTVGYSYVWGGQSWLVDKTVLITRTPTTQTEGDYWFVVKEYDGNEYNCGSLYHWEDETWQEVAIRKENVMNRTMAHLYQSNDTIRQSVSTVDGKVATMETKVTETDARVGLVASVPTELVGVKPANYNSDTETIDIINDEIDLETNWKEYAISKGNGTYYYVVGQQLPYDVYVCVVDSNVATFTKSNIVSYDGVNFYKINIASIFTTANEDGSGIQLNAQKIQFNGEGIFHDKNGITKINGSAIETGTLSTSQIIGAINQDEKTDLKIKADRIIVDGADISLAGKNINLTSDNITINSTNFNVSSTGILQATGADISGHIRSKNGSIGDFEILQGGLLSDYIKIQPQSVFIPQGSSLNIDNDIEIGADSGTTYISTNESKNFVIKNKSGAGIMFSNETSDESFEQFVTISDHDVKLNHDIKPSYGYDGTLIGYDYISTNCVYTCNYSVEPNNTTLFQDYQLNLTLSFATNPTSSTAEKALFTYNISLIVPKGSVSGTLSLTFNSKSSNEQKGWGWQWYHTVTFDGVALGVSQEYGTDKSDISCKIGGYNVEGRNTLFSLGNFCPANDSTDESTGFLLGDGAHAWNTIRARTATITTSDRNEKKDINVLNNNYETFFNALRPVTFIYKKSDSNRRHTGFIAQEVEEALNDANISTQDFAGICIENDTYALRYEEFIPINTDQIQKLKKRVAEQDKLISDLTSRLEALEEKLK